MVCPGADAKIFVTATPEERARRRFLERQAQGEETTYEAVLALIRNRDARDSARDSSPMRCAEDADLLDTTEMDIEAAFDAAVGLIERKISQ